MSPEHEARAEIIRQRVPEISERLRDLLAEMTGDLPAPIQPLALAHALGTLLAQNLMASADYAESELGERAEAMMEGLQMLTAAAATTAGELLGFAVATAYYGDDDDDDDDTPAEGAGEHPN